MTRNTIASFLGYALQLSLAAEPLGGDPHVQQSAYIKSSGPLAQAIFGSSIALGGDTLVVGAPGETTVAVSDGAAYVYVRDGSGWSPQARLESPAPFFFENFGRSVAVSGETVVVGTSRYVSLQTGNAAYAFVRQGTSWSLETTLGSSNLEIGDNFGFSVAADGDTLVVGAYAEDSSAAGVNGNQASNATQNSGAAYVFVRDGTTWSQQAYLKASNPGADDNFGVSVAISGDTLVVSAPNEDSNATGVDGEQGNNLASGSGAVYVFVRQGTTWSQQAYLKASNTAPFDGFGGSVTVSGDTVVVAATGEDSSATGVNGDQANNAASAAGALYVFTRDGTTWGQEAYVKASNTGANDNFGFSLSLAGDVLVVGATGEDSNATGVNGDESNNGLGASGAAYLFRRDGTTWCQTAYLKASVTNANDFFGTSVVTDGDELAVGALLEDQLALDSGAAYVFELGVLAAVVFRNAGSNQASYAAAAFEIGGTFAATVDNALAGQLTSLLFAFDTPVSLTLGGGQTLLCLDFGSGELFTGSNLAPTSSAGGVDSYLLPVPALPSLVGFVFSSQAIQFGTPPFELSNAQDFTIGGF